MKNIKTEIIINAPKEVVWEALMDHKAYGTWNPFITSIEGQALEGEKIKINVKPSGGKATAFTPRVLKMEPNREFRWLGHLFFSGLFDGEHYFIVESIDSNTTRFIHGEKFSGILVSLILKLMGDSTIEGFYAMNEQLKVLAEKKYKS